MAAVAVGRGQAIGVAAAAVAAAQKTAIDASADAKHPQPAAVAAGLPNGAAGSSSSSAPFPADAAVVLTADQTRALKLMQRSGWFAPIPPAHQRMAPFKHAPGHRLPQQQLAEQLMRRAAAVDAVVSDPMRYGIPAQTSCSGSCAARTGGCTYRVPTVCFVLQPSATHRAFCVKCTLWADKSVRGAPARQCRRARYVEQRVVRWVVLALMSVKLVGSPPPNAVLLHVHFPPGAVAAAAAAPNTSTGTGIGTGTGPDTNGAHDVLRLDSSDPYHSPACVLLSYRVTVPYAHDIVFALPDAYSGTRTHGYGRMPRQPVCLLSATGSPLNPAVNACWLECVCARPFGWPKHGGGGGSGGDSGVIDGAPRYGESDGAEFMVRVVRACGPRYESLNECAWSQCVAYVSRVGVPLLHTLLIQTRQSPNDAHDPHTLSRVIALLCSDECARSDGSGVDLFAPIPFESWAAAQLSKDARVPSPFSRSAPPLRAGDAKCHGGAGLPDADALWLTPLDLVSPVVPPAPPYDVAVDDAARCVVVDVYAHVTRGAHRVLTHVLSGAVDALRLDVVLPAVLVRVIVGFVLPPLLLLPVPVVVDAAASRPACVAPASAAAALASFGVLGGGRAPVRLYCELSCVSV